MSAAFGSNANTAGKINVNEIKLTSATQISSRLSISVSSQIPRVYTFANDHSRIIPQFPGELTASHVNRMNLCRCRAEQAVGEAAGRGSISRQVFAFHET